MTLCDPSQTGRSLGAGGREFMCPGVWILTECSFRGKMLEIPRNGGYREHFHRKSARGTLRNEKRYPAKEYLS